MWLTEAQEDTLLQSKNIHVFLTTLVLPISLWIMGNATGIIQMVQVLFLSWFAFLPGEIYAILELDNKAESGKSVWVQIGFEMFKSSVMPLVWFGMTVAIFTVS